MPKPVTGGPLVTVIMPVYRPDEFTDLAISSAINQSYQNIEIIIVDDGSGGDAAERLNKWAAEDSRIKVVLNEQNSGAYTSRNIGYSMASGEFLTIFDGDDWQHPQKIELLVRAAEKQSDRTARLRALDARGRGPLLPLPRMARRLHHAGARLHHVPHRHHPGTIWVTGTPSAKRRTRSSSSVTRPSSKRGTLEVSEAPLTLSLVSSFKSLH